MFLAEKEKCLSSTSLLMLKGNPNLWREPKVESEGIRDARHGILRPIKPLSVKAGWKNSSAIVSDIVMTEPGMTNSYISFYGRSNNM
jgi:hypothetical protein